MPSILTFISILFGSILILVSSIILMIIPSVIGVILFILGFLIIFAGLILFNTPSFKLNFQAQNGYQNNFNKTNMSNNFNSNTKPLSGIIIIFLGLFLLIFVYWLLGIIAIYWGIKLLINPTQSKFKIQQPTSPIFENDSDGFEDEIPSNTTITNYFGNSTSRYSTSNNYSQFFR